MKMLIYIVSTSSVFSLSKEKDSLSRFGYLKMSFPLLLEEGRNYPGIVNLIISQGRSM
jgi:hypothetical protein